LQGHVGIANIAIGHCTQINPSLWAGVQLSAGNKSFGCCSLNTVGERTQNIVLGSDQSQYITSSVATVCNNVLIGNLLKPGGYSQTSISNVAIGYCLLGGVQNESVAIGYQALANRNFGCRSVAIGVGAIGSPGFSGPDSLFNNIAIGTCSLYNFRSHLEVDIESSGTPYNISIGTNALKSSYYGNSNTAIGLNSQFFATSSRDNVAIGNFSSYCNATGGCNTAIGEGALRCSVGSFNTAIGHWAGCNLVLGNNNTFIGPCSFAITSTMNNTVILGSNSMVIFRSDGVISSTSDSRDKKDVELIPTGFQFLNDIRPVKFTWNMRNQGKVDIEDSGFIAQQLLDTVVNHDVKTWLSVVLDMYPETLMVTPSKLIPVIVRAIQEVSTKRSSDIAKLKLEIAELKKRLQ
jgi:hypothetical protein